MGYAIGTVNQSVHVYEWGGGLLCCDVREVVIQTFSLSKSDFPHTRSRNVSPTRLVIQC